MSLDFFRGVIMLLLVGEAIGFYDLLSASSLKGTILYSIGHQFQHHPWNGLHLWDLGQPFFMFISGVAIAFSYGKRRERGVSWTTSLSHALERSFLLFALGWAIYLISPAEGEPGGAFLYDILPQLAIACLAAFLWLRRSLRVQAIFTFGLLVLTDLLYRLWAVPGFDQPFVPDHNFGSYIDRLLMGRLSTDHWVVFSAVPMICFTVWGAMAGQILRSSRRPAQKAGILSLAGLAGVGAGFALSLVTPMIRKTATSSFVIAAGGFCLLALALAYWLVDLVKFRTGIKFFAVVGMNPLFIYVFAQTGGAEWLRGIVRPFTGGLFAWAGEWPVKAATSLAVCLLLWSLCYWLYRKKIFIRI